jgi:cellulase/cellobiase CelA1
MSTQQVTLRAGIAGNPVLNERIAAAIIKPGALVQESAGTVTNHATAAANAQKLFAQKNISVAGGLDTAYAVGETVGYGAYHAGQEVSALVAAAATAITDGAALESAGDGTVRIATADAATDTAQRDAIVGYAMEAVDNSIGASVVRIKIRVA